MKFLRFCLVMVVFGSLFMIACGGGGGGGSAPSGMREVYQPGWYGTQGSPDFIFTYGTAERVSQAAAEQAAQANASAEAARNVEMQVQAMVRNFESEAGVDNPQVLALTEQVVRTTANQRFQGTQVTQRQMMQNENGRYVAFIQLAIPREAVNRDFMNRIRNEEALYNEFRASQAFAEMDRFFGSE
ncbi:MAG: LPP20 family lipoprotein [Candidatus Cloacimonetes bacterium]|nr:LPP20 family lipoprotein [Candidatus Cloacimonadota bacterium]